MNFIFFDTIPISTVHQAEHVHSGTRKFPNGRFLSYLSMSPNFAEAVKNLYLLLCRRYLLTYQHISSRDNLSMLLAVTYSPAKRVTGQESTHLISTSFHMS